MRELQLFDGRSEELALVPAVLAAVQNPEGWLEERVAIDDFSESRRRDSATSTGAVIISDADVRRLLPRRVRPRDAFTIRLGAT